jgi:hypothetical protein
MDLVEGVNATPPDCWSGFDDLLFAVEVDPTLGGRDFTMGRIVDAMKIASHGNVLEKCDTAVEELEQVIRTHPDTLEAVLAAHYLSKTLWVPSLVLPFWTNILHEIVSAGKLAQMEEVAVEAIESMACYGAEAASFGLDVLACFLSKNCPPKVKGTALEFFIDTTASDGRTTAFSAVADESEDPVIRQWNAARKLEDVGNGGGSSAQ